jgi:hypothetical protein
VQSVKGDIALLSFLVVAFATLLTVHVTLSLGLARHGHRWRAIAAFLIPPLAPYWGWRVGKRGQVALWVAASGSYMAALWLAMR